MSVSLRRTPALMDLVRELSRCDGPVWGLALVKATGRPSGTVYPLLERLERAGHLSSAWEDDPARVGPRRRLYELTSSGRGWVAALERDAARSRVPVPAATWPVRRPVIHGAEA